VVYRLHEAHQFILCGLPTSLIVTLKIMSCTTTKDFYFILKELKNVIVMGHNSSQMLAVPDSYIQHISKEIKVK